MSRDGSRRVMEFSEKKYKLDCLKLYASHNSFKYFPST